MIVAVVIAGEVALHVPRAEVGRQKATAKAGV